MTSRFLSLLVVPLFFAGAATASDPFIDGLSPEEREAIGLSALTPAQQAALERAVERYVAGRSEEAVVDATAEVRSELTEQINEREQELAAKEMELAAKEEELVVVKAELEKKTDEAVAVDEGADTSLLDRARVLLTPGTKVEFATIESRLAEPFRGWEKGTLFRLENGQVWQVQDSKKYWSPREEAGKPVTIEPGSFGSFFMRLDGVRSTPKVELVSRN